jgi:hypothetical protein
MSIVPVHWPPVICLCLYALDMITLAIYGTYQLELTANCPIHSHGRIRVPAPKTRRVPGTPQAFHPCREGKCRIDQGRAHRAAE